MLNNIPPQLIMNLFGINTQQFGEIMQLVKQKNPQQLEQYVRNLYQGQGRDLESEKKKIIDKLGQFGLKI